MKKIAFLILNLLLFSAGLFAQDEANSEMAEEILISGKYVSGNLYILNPSVNEGFSIQNVKVNGKDYAYNTESNAFEISLAEHQPNEFVFIQIQHSPAAIPEVINENCLVQEVEFALPSFIYNKKTKLLEWKLEQLDAKCDYRLEQMLYGKWITVKKLGSPADMISNSYLPVLLSGMNAFRIVQTDGAGKELSSPLIKLKSPNKRILLVSDKVKEYIEFTAVTHYELYDANGFFIKRGTAQKVNVADLKKGDYWINFDGKETMIMKK